MAKIPFGDYYYISLDEYNTLMGYFPTNYDGLPGYLVDDTNFSSVQTPKGFYIPVSAVNTTEEESALFAMESFEFHPVFESVQGIYSPYFT